MRSRLLAVWLVLLPVLAGGVGAAAGVGMSRTHRTVRLSLEVAEEEAGRLKTQSFELQAYHAAGARRRALMDEARRIEGAFRRGTALFGAWCGLVVSIKLWSLRRRPMRREYEAEAGLCLACGRCYMSCPKERLRLKLMVTRKNGATDA